MAARRGGDDLSHFQGRHGEVQRVGRGSLQARREQQPYYAGGQCETRLQLQHDGKWYNEVDVW